MTQHNRETLLALADRCKKAMGPDRELDGAISEAITGEPQPDGAVWKWTPRYTASLDAAMSLIPEGMAWTVGQNVHHRHWVASLNYLDEEGAPQSMAGSNAARSPALALVAAALRATASSLEVGK